MKLDKMNNADNFRMRSKKVRDLLGELPQSLVSTSAAVLIIVFVILLSVICIVPYPHSQGECILLHFLMTL